MGADREMSQDMTNTDIAVLLAEAADGAEIGIAPTQAVIRGGRRRRARRWALATAAAVVIAGSTGTLAFAGLPGGGDGHRGGAVATRPSTPEQRHVYEPQITPLAQGTYKGKKWYVSLLVWGVPRDAAEAARQFDALKGMGLEPANVHKTTDLIGKTSFFVTRVYGDEPGLSIMYNTTDRLEPFASTDLTAIGTRYSPEAESGGLVVGMVTKTAREVTCTWKNGATTVAHRVSMDYDLTTRDAVIRPAAGYPAANWFVCQAPAGTTYASAEVTK